MNDAVPSGMPGDPFDEAYYLTTYPDVRAAVDAGTYPCGREHFEMYGRAERRFPSAQFEADLLSMSDAERRARVGAVWSQDVEKDPGWYWMAHPAVRARLNRIASGRADWDSYDRLAALVRERGGRVPISRAVSLGCGFGGLERDLVRRGIITEIDAYDIAPGAIEEARRLAGDAGLSGLRYHVADLEHVDFPPGAVDVVFAHQSVHHVERLEELFATVAAMLRPGGLFHLHEFVGPTRFQWTEAQVGLVNTFLERLPPRLRALPSGEPRALQGRATVAQMIAADPSEAVRSADILPVLAKWFDIVEHRPLGGALLHLGLGGIAQNFDPDSPGDAAVLAGFFAEEDAAMRDSRVGSDFAVVTAARR